MTAKASDLKDVRSLAGRYGFEGVGKRTIHAESSRQVIDQKFLVCRGNVGAPADHLVHFARPTVPIEPLLSDKRRTVTSHACRLQFFHHLGIRRRLRRLTEYKAGSKKDPTKQKEFTLQH